MGPLLLFLAAAAALMLQLPPAHAPTPVQKQPILPSSYAGIGACMSCHKSKVDSFLQTAHHLDSRPADATSVLGDFTPGRNRLNTRDPNVFFTMEQRADALFVTATTGAPPAQQTRAERMDIVIGSGRKGQTYLYWRDNQLFELPVSSWTAHKAWVNSPGYPDGIVNFDRPVLPRCLECHSTAFESWPGPPNTFNRSGFILGIQCEKCHGPARDHVARRSETPGSTKVIEVVNTGKLSRDLQIALCATCHAAGILPNAPAFSYRPGAPLSEYFEPLPPNQALNPEVHGDQVGLLESSRCYRESASMTCSTCHDLHIRQRDPVAFATQCRSCHKVDACKLFPSAGANIEARCVDCHMPNRRSGVISVTSTSSQMVPEVRTHAITVYPDVTAAVLKTMGR